MLFLNAPPATAQDPLQALVVEDLGLTLPAMPTPRATALAGAFIASVNDVSALAINPAGLGRVRSLDATLAFHFDRVGTRSGLAATGALSTADDAGLASFAVSIPFRVYRGSFSVAAGVFRAYESSTQISYDGFNEARDASERYLLQQRGSVLAWYAGIGGMVADGLAAGASVYALDGRISPFTQSSVLPRVLTVASATFISDTVELDVDGVGARVGGQLLVVPGTRLGVVLSTPAYVHTAGEATLETVAAGPGGTGTINRTQVRRSTDYILPLRVDGGLSIRVGPVRVELDIGYSDWSQASVQKRRPVTRRLEPAFRNTVDFRVGAEWSLPRWPVRLRAGHARVPYALQMVPSDRTGSELEFAAIADDRRQWTAGAGALIAESITVDAAWQLTTGRRETTLYAQEDRRQRLTAGVSWRF